MSFNGENTLKYLNLLDGKREVVGNLTAQDWKAVVTWANDTLDTLNFIATTLESVDDQISLNQSQASEILLDLKEKFNYLQEQKIDHSKSSKKRVKDILQDAHFPLVDLQESNEESGKISETNEGCGKREFNVPITKKSNWNINGKYILAVCIGGRMNNRLKCFLRFLWIATMLNRTLIVPMEDLNSRRPHFIKEKQPYDYNVVFNISHTQACFPPGRVETMDSYLRKVGKTELRVERVITFPGGLQRLSMTLPKVLKIPPKKEWSTLVHSDEIAVENLTKVVSDVKESVITIINLDLLHLRSLPVWLRLGLATGWNISCHVIIQPHSAVIAAAEGFVSSYVGSKYAAAHMRRSDFFRYCSAPKNCYRPIRELARCLQSKMGKSGLDTLFLSTDAESEEVVFLESLLSKESVLGPPITVVKLPRSLADRFWAEKLIKEKYERSEAARATIERIICSMASEFYSSPDSTFSGGIASLRIASNRSSCHDSLICD